MPYDQGHMSYLLGGHEQRLRRLEAGQAGMRKDLDQIRAQISAWALRVAILAVLWTAAIGSHLTREQAGELLAGLLKAALKL